MMKLSIALFVLLQLLSASGVLAQPYFISSVNQFDDSIGLRCGNGSTFNYINVERNSEVRFWLNRTQGARPAGFEPDLDLRPDVTLTKNGDEARFRIKPELEGHYSCGVAPHESDTIPLISTERGVQIPMEFVLESGMTASIPCPIQVGELNACYYGMWYKDNVNIIRVGPPEAQCGNPRSAESNAVRDYILDRNFILTIPNVTPQDNGTYVCEIFSVIPAIDTRSTVSYGRSVGQSLSVDEIPTFINAPEDSVVGADDTTKTLSSMAIFHCTAAGVPRPQIEWSYLASLTGEDQSLDGIANENETMVGMDEGGRIIVSSTLVFHSLTRRDGGVVNCRAISRVGSNVTTARLTVLGAPLEISIIPSFDGTILYQITLPVTLNRPTHLNFTYIDSGNRKRAHSRNMESSLMEFNNLKQIYLREDIMSLPFPKFHLNISLYATRGSQIIQGPFITTSEPIDSEKPSLKTVISLGAGLGGSLLLLILIVIVFILIVVILSIRSKKKVKAMKTEAKKIEKDVNTACDEATRDVEDLENRLNKLDTETGKQLKTCLETNLTRLKDHIDSARQTVVPDDDGELPDKEVELNTARSVLGKLLNVVSIQEDTSNAVKYSDNVIEMPP